MTAFDNPSLYLMKDKKKPRAIACCQHTGNYTPQWAEKNEI